jgi:VWFA-related protein
MRTMRRMTRKLRGNLGVTIAIACAAHAGCALLHAQSTPQAGQQASDRGASVYTLKARSEIVLTNVVVRDKKTGVALKGLKASDFTILEDGKPQTLSSLEFEDADEAVALQETTRSGAEPRTVAQMLQGTLGTDTASLKNHRLIVMFFDLSNMQQDDIDRSVGAAQTYIKSRMLPADLVAVVSLSTSLQLNHDFTANKNALLVAVGRFNGTQSQGFAAGTTGSSSGTADNGSSFTADDSEYNNLNTDRELYAIQSIAKSLERIDQRKSMLYFSGGLARNGVENQAALRSATNAAVRANMSIYSVDSRGLQAINPVGDASTGSLRGTSSYSGAAMQGNLDSNFGSQETLATLASDTGGKSFFDSNDFAPAFQQVQRDTEAYYTVAYRPKNLTRDGRYRHLQVKVARADVKLEYRPGYFAPADFKHQKTEDREQALQTEMQSDLPASDVAVYVQAFYFRLDANRYDVPVSAIIPASQLAFVKNGDKDKASIDFLGELRNAQKIVVGNLRETIKLQIGADQDLQRKNIQYNTAFTLAPGTYHLKLVVRENQTGTMGSFETDLHVPDLKKNQVKLSSIVLGSQRLPVSPKQAEGNPMVQEGRELVPNIAHTFRQDQQLYLLYEVYDPAKASSQGQSPTPSANGVHLLSSVEFLRGGSMVYETAPIEVKTLNSVARGAESFAVTVPLAALPPGLYVCQVNVIDDALGAFSFPRMAIKIVAPLPAAPDSTAISPLQHNR